MNTKQTSKISQVSILENNSTVAMDRAKGKAKEVELDQEK